MRQMKDMDIGSLMGDLLGGGGGGGQSQGGGLPGMGGMNLPPGYTPPSHHRQAMDGSNSKSMSRNKRKRKRKKTRRRKRKKDDKK
jgi:hypothetical protein